MRTAQGSASFGQSIHATEKMVPAMTGPIPCCQRLLELPKIGKILGLTITQRRYELDHD